MDSIPNKSLQSLNSQVPGSWSSLSCPSEPPDVGNWFSSYEYRSPDPDSNFGFEESALRGPESEGDEEKGEGVEDDKHNEDLSFAKSLKSFSSRSLLSEPPDIGNWFSSYVYESSVSDDSSNLFKIVVSEENECEEERFDFEVINEDEVGSQNVHPKGCVDHNSSPDKNTSVKQPSTAPNPSRLEKVLPPCMQDRTLEHSLGTANTIHEETLSLESQGDSSVEIKKNLTTSNTSHLEKILQPCIQGSTLQHNLGPSCNSKYEETLSLNHGSPGCNREAHLMSLDIERPPELVVYKNDIREAKSETKIQHDKLEKSASLATRFSARSSTCARNKENVGDMNSMQGFVSVRKSRSTGANDEDSWKKPKEMSLQDSTNTGTGSLACEEHVVTKRKALTEATNLQQSNAMEITGKWQCPQKGKPNLGPALKQLRLERWVRRV